VVGQKESGRWSRRASKDERGNVTDLWRFHVTQAAGLRRPCLMLTSSSPSVSFIVTGHSKLGLAESA
jgi:hypothetical protein